MNEKLYRRRRREQMRSYATDIVESADAIVLVSLKHLVTGERSVRLIEFGDAPDKDSLWHEIESWFMEEAP